ncbi:MAG: Hpt domain-containing protein [Gammaproteobacteria bacterium]|nr:Hpt domain-containing protein [Gammaproteobacteria bacterium]
MTLQNPFTFSKSKWFAILSRYRLIISAIAAFVVIDIAVMIINMQLSIERSQLAQVANLANRQSVLVDNLSRLVGQLHALSERNGNTSPVIQELQMVQGIFSDTQTAMLQGGWTPGMNLQPIKLQPLDNKTKLLIQPMAQSWPPLALLLEEVYFVNGKDVAVVAKAHKQLSLAAPQFMMAGQSLANSLDKQAEAKTTAMKNTQLTGLVLAVLNFFFINFRVIRNMQKSEDEVRDYAAKVETYAFEVIRAKRESDEILGYVNDGLFVMDEKGIVGTQHSASLKKILMEEDIAGRRFIDIMRPQLDQKTFNMLSDYVDLMFKRSVKEKMLTSHNPVEQIEMTKEVGGVSHKKYLDFKFSRVYEGKSIKSLLVTVSDVTIKIALEEKLEASSEKSKRQMELMFGLIHVGPSMLKQFVDATSNQLSEINALLKSSENLSEKKSIIDPIFRIVHTIKGNAALLDLGLFVEQAHMFEEALLCLNQKSESISGEDFINIAIQLDELANVLRDTMELLGKLIQLQTEFGGAAENKHAIVRAMQKMTLRMCEKTGKQIELIGGEFDIDQFPEKYRAIAADITVQLLRNAVAHGIELPHERRAFAKSEIGRIKLKTTMSHDGYELCVQDDGKGINLDSIRQKANELGLLESSDKATDSKWLNVIFESGFSTADSVDVASGRGVGMDIIKQRVAEVGGSIVLRHAPGKGCQFNIKFPLDDLAKVA